MLGAGFLPGQVKCTEKCILSFVKAVPIYAR